MAKRKTSGALTWIVKEAKRLRRKYPRRFSEWKQYVAEASAIYASKHGGKSPVGKKHHKPKRIVRKKIRGISTRSKSHTDKNRITANIQIGSINRTFERPLRKKSAALLRQMGYSQLAKDVMKKEIPLTTVMSVVDKAANELRAKIATGNYSKKLTEKAKKALSVWNVTKTIFYK